MIRFREDLAVIAAVRRSLEQDSDNPLISAEDVKRLSSDMENETGHAILNGFTDETMNQFFHENPNYFRHTGKHTDSGNPIYGIRADTFADIVRDMIVRFDPAINYPLDFLQATGLTEDLGIGQHP